MKATLLIELLTEELPPKSLLRLAQCLLGEMQKGLADAGFIAAENAGRCFATPRRLAVQFAEVLAIQPDQVVQRKGPAVASGLDAEGRPSKALEGFLRAVGLRFEQLARVQEGKAEYFVARIDKAGEPLDRHLAALVEAALKKLPVAKMMRWGAGEAQFVRPAHALVMLHGSRVVPGSVLGLESGRITSGHRFQSVGVVELQSADEYERQLEQTGRVIADFALRRELIRIKLDEAAGDLRWLADSALLDEVTALVEWPAVYVASFDAEFLRVPQECLILTMKQNQKYFPLLDGNGRLQNKFLVVSNMRLEDPHAIIQGNERVVRARLSDAKFFFEQDEKTPLAARVPKLDAVVYHNKLGSVGDKARRLSRLSALIARRLAADEVHAGRAALLAKADLVTDMVGEFPELQGIMGRYYARHDGEGDLVADAIEGHYHPRFSGDTLPAGNVACASALADKLDSLVAFFGIGQMPSGDKDPYALRRAALGVLRILMETPLPLDLDDLVEDACGGFAAGLLTGDYRTALKEFMHERLRGLLRGEGSVLYEQNVIDAVLALSPTRIDLVPVKLAAVQSFLALPEAQALAAANKRIVNILRQAKSGTPQGGIAIEADIELLQEPAEKALFDQVLAIAPRIRSLVASEDYEAALLSLAGLRNAVDAFFDGVMVMVEEPLTRANRLALLAQLAQLMNQVADISRL